MSARCTPVTGPIQGQPGRGGLVPTADVRQSWNSCIARQLLQSHTARDGCEAIDPRKPRTWWLRFTASISAHPLDPLSARGPRLEGIAEVLGLTGNLAVSELHDTHRLRRRAVVCKDEFSDPKVGSTEYSLHLKTLLVR